MPCRLICDKARFRSAGYRLMNVLPSITAVVMPTAGKIMRSDRFHEPGVSALFIADAPFDCRSDRPQGKLCSKWADLPSAPQVWVVVHGCDGSQHRMIGMRAAPFTSSRTWHR